MQQLSIRHKFLGKQALLAQLLTDQLLSLREFACEDTPRWDFYEHFTFLILEIQSIWAV